MDDKLRFPIGKYKSQKNIDNTTFMQYINTLETFPKHLVEATTGLTKKLDSTYRTSGWSIRQLVHHLADSHMNAFMRFKLALTEQSPIIKPYKEASWANLADYKGAIDSSLKIIEGVHYRWIELIQAVNKQNLERIYIHPEFKNEFSLKEVIAQYAWHCRHHLAHIRLAKEIK